MYSVCFGDCSLEIKHLYANRDEQLGGCEGKNIGGVVAATFPFQWTMEAWGSLRGPEGLASSHCYRVI